MKSILFALPLALCAQNCHIQLNLAYPLQLEATGPYQVIYDGGEVRIESRFAKRELVQEKNFGLVWGDEVHAARTFTLIPLKDSRLLINGSQYPGTLTFTLGRPVDNEVSLEWPLQSMMQKSELNAYSQETLKALAITLRTDLASEEKPLDSKELGYEGSSLLFQYPKITASIVETKDHVMRFNGGVFPTTYCKDAAGKLANFSQIFRTADHTPDGNLQTKTATQTWKKSLSKSELTAKLNLEGFKKIGFYKEAATQKIYAVKVEDERGPRVILIDRFIKLLGLKSNTFDLKFDPQGFHFEGSGDGLGVGLCLKTAEMLSKSGHTHEAILKNCFQNVEIGVLEK